MKKKLLLSFITPIIILLTIFLLVGICPFGDKTIIVIDSNTQYISFITYLKSIFMGINDFKYTFSASLGQDLIPLFGYYMMSPLNLITLLFKIENMQLALTIIILIKIGLSGLTMEYFMQKKYKDKNTLLFSLCYALMTYSMVYIYHLMWLEGIILFPLVILGIDNIFKDKKPLLYIISLTMSIITNYYIGIMICLASVIYFIYKYILDYKIINKMKVFINYAISSILSGLMSMFIIIPSIMALSKGKASFSLDNLNFKFITSYLRIIAKSFSASMGSLETWHGGPMIACGMIIVVLLILYFLNKKIEKRNKIINGTLLFVLASTFAIQALDLLFHGLTVPNCFDYRHAFIFVFFMILIASESYFNLNKDKKDLKITAIIMILISILIYFAKYKFNTSSFNISLIYSLLISLIIIFVLYKNKNIYKILLIITIIDLFINAMVSILTSVVPDMQYVSKYKKSIKETSYIIEELKDYDNSFYRMEKTFDRSKNKGRLAINDSMIFDYNGISHFDSTTRSDVEELLEKFGFRRLLTRAYYNESGSTKAADMLFGIKYVLSYEDYKNYTKVLNKDNLSVYKNSYYLSIGYAINNTIQNIDSNNPFENANNTIKTFTNINSDIYIKADYKLLTNNVTINKDIYTPTNDGSITYTIDINNNNELYFYLPNNGEIENDYVNAKMYINNKYIDNYFTKYNRGVISLGKHKIGDKIELKFKFNKELYISNSYFYYEDIKVLEKQYNELSKYQVDLNKLSSSNLKGNINLDKDMKLLFTIPYDLGWNIKVDGKAVKVNKTLDALMYIDLTKGEHNIELEYTPDGLNTGILVSSISLLLTITYIIIKRDKK